MRLSDSCDIPDLSLISLWNVPVARNPRVDRYGVFMKEMGLEGKVTVAFIKKKWENLKQKYKNPPTGRSTEGGEMTAATWKWYEAMDKALGSSHSITPVAIGSSSAPGGRFLSFPFEERAGQMSSTSCSSCGSTAASTSTTCTCTASTCTASTCTSTAPEPPSTSPAPKRAKKEPVWLLAIKELERREEARDVRDSEWERALMEREDRRDREVRDREDREMREMREREERRDRELKERDYAQKAREERHARETAGREERFLTLMDYLVTVVFKKIAVQHQ
ncbi:hypothetical protein SKAU_G00078210 [Synaphobranchus kaupii]|uniref:MADF domain-containing protein n=1 Tax=Synaphobranchus kaupii TaxID=118154 RepID=A0A9Q1FU42_SYNKA|nr:hypothetical protein SKAU_G00078210 [Synaphobranchus kaupii]